MPGRSPRPPSTARATAGESLLRSVFPACFPLDPSSALRALLRPSQEAPRLRGRWFDKEKKIPPAAGKKPHIAFILLDDYGYAPATRLEAYAPTA